MGQSIGIWREPGGAPTFADVPVALSLLSLRSSRMRRSWTRAALVLVGGFACGGGSDPVAPDPCATAPRLEVSSGTRPTFTWTPACGIDILDVVDVTPGGDGVTVWGIGSAGGMGAGLAPPVQYPEVVPGEVGLPLPLVSGRQYRVSIHDWEPPAPGCLFGCPTVTRWIATATFSP